MGSKSAGPVKNEKKFFKKVKETITDIWGGTNEAMADLTPKPDKNTRKSAADKKPNTNIKTEVIKAKKQVIAAKAKAVKKSNSAAARPKFVTAEAKKAAAVAKRAKPILLMKKNTATPKRKSGD